MANRIVGWTWTDEEGRTPIFEGSELHAALPKAERPSDALIAAWRAFRDAARAEESTGKRIYFAVTTDHNMISAHHVKWEDAEIAYDNGGGTPWGFEP